MSAEPQDGQETPIPGPHANPPSSTPSGWQPPLQDAAPDPGKPQPQYRYVRMRPHRGGTILALGISGVMMAIIGGMMVGACYICPPVWVLPLASLGLSIPAWVMGQNDLAAINSQRMDPAGKETTIAGMIAGIVGTALVALGVLLVIAVIVIYIVVVAAAAASN
jgi:hypothetical protein